MSTLRGEKSKSRNRSRIVINVEATEGQASPPPRGGRRKLKVVAVVLIALVALLLIGGYVWRQTLGK